MKKAIVTLIISLASLSASSSDLSDVRKNIGTDLNETVKEIKDSFKSVDSQLSADNTQIKDIYRTAKALRDSSQELETNPTVLLHGKDKVEDCRDRKELIWDGSKWVCQEPEYKSDCVPAYDEYRYESPVGSGNYVCKKSQAGHEISYDWAYRGNSNNCHSNTYRKKVYRCFYVNKKGQDIDVEESYCGKTSDLTNENGARCTSTWQVGSWGGCDKTCGGGTQTREVKCKDNHFCPGTKPAESQACNTQACPIAWSTGAWGRCEEIKSCRWGGSWKDGREWVCSVTGHQQTRSVYCKAGFTCAGAKPATTQRCSPGEKHCGKRCEG